jgi:predicted DNA-binding antitoxin AbrB/MazE fold protein
MSYIIRAIYENGSFRPLDPVAFEPCDLVSLVVTPLVVEEGDSPSPSSEASSSRTIAQLLAEANELPLESSDDGFSGADHDEVLYDWRK